MGTKQVIVVRKDLNMRKGKMSAQSAHSSEAFITRQIQKKILEAQKQEIEAYGSIQDDYERFICVIAITKPQVEWILSSFRKIVVGAKDEEELKDIIMKAKAAGLVVNEVIDSGLTEFHGVPTLTCAAIGPDYDEVLDPITGHLPLL